jgi:hypothetical protein
VFVVVRESGGNKRKKRVEKIVQERKKFEKGDKERMRNAQREREMGGGNEDRGRERVRESLRERV